MSFDPSCSPFNSPYRSNFGDLVCTVPTGVTVKYQCLQQYKVWPGANINYKDRGSAINHSLYFYDSSNPAYWDGVTGLPGVTFRTNFRKRFLLSQVDWALGGAGYTEVSTFSGVGFVPVTDGAMPTSIGSWPPVKSGSETQPFKYPILHPDYDDSFGGASTTGPTWDWTHEYGDKYDNPDVSPTGQNHQTWTTTYSSAILFADHLSPCLSRLSARAFATFPGSSTSYSERFDEWWDTYAAGPSYFSTDTNPAHYTMNPVSLGTVDSLFYLAPIQPLVSGYERLQSGWYWATQECEFDAIADNPLAPIMATRVRFLTDKPIKYWIAKARVINVDRVRNPSGTLVDVTYIRSGVAMPSAPVEIPLHPDDTDFVTTSSALSAGAFCFAILGESPAAWSSRTGITVH